VTTRYITSAFLGHTTAEDLLKGFNTACSGLNLESLLQVSMDGPNVNLKFLRLLKEEMQQNPNHPVFLDMGSCGIHVVHGAFRTGFKKVEWKLEKFLGLLIQLSVARILTWEIP